MLYSIVYNSTSLSGAIYISPNALRAPAHAARVQMSLTILYTDDVKLFNQVGCLKPG